MSTTIAGIRIPDSAMARAATEFVRDTEPDLLYHHSRRVFLFGALTGEREGLKYDPELLYIGAMFHDIGLVEAYSSKAERFEVDGANAARDFLEQYGVNGCDIDQVWMSIALHTTPGIPKHMKPVVALVTAGVEMDVLGIAYDAFTESQRSRVVDAHPRVETFKTDIIDAFASGTIRKPETTFGNVKADVLALRDPTYKRMNFCEIILGSAWDDRRGHAHCAGCGSDDHA
ncbi:HD domain-containing protein [Burkholderia oklahomensis]|uniref:HD domain protein n=1 Tax=Burkholderia oklahomensis TaxID=342113 RepID=A0AAI8BDV0_9BURK|nr:HD domain-containing protein [Burkholderia oklahomensis]AIO70300.1 HD domain protein [Burkholderia oklahomensis]AOI39901.1 phosphohydrolase [Burkholderia oklahomensis EO147]KUY51879.1 phosphohydrolase [Burkholderia oklahomensis EO147]QPS39736.1 HD domain-containing protein [Burkholderia oklahomensis]